MDTPFEFENQKGRVVYIRPVKAEDLPDEIKAQTNGRDELCAIHGANGEVIALAPDRKMALHFARLHEFAPVSLH